MPKPWAALTLIEGVAKLLFMMPHSMRERNGEREGGGGDMGVLRWKKKKE
jgi:hypothetical protein